MQTFTAHSSAIEAFFDGILSSEARSREFSAKNCDVLEIRLFLIIASPIVLFSENE
jgi:hypothetical protein